MTLTHMFKNLSRSMKNIFKVLIELLERKTIVSVKNAQMEIIEDYISQKERLVVEIIQN